MARLLPLMLAVTIYYVLIDGSKRTVKLVYKPFGAQMCRRLCQDSFYSFLFNVGDLSCKRVPERYSGSRNINSPGDSFTCGKRGTPKDGIRSLAVATRFDTCKPDDKAVRSTESLDLNTTLHKACEEGQLCMVKNIISRGMADINVRGRIGRTPVMAAARKRQVAVFKFLVSKGCDLTAIDDFKDTVLHVACYGGSICIVRNLIVNHKFDTDMRGWTGRTPVMMAAYNNHRGLVELLVSKGCHLTATDDLKNNVLHLVCITGHLDMVKNIITKDVVSIDSKGEYGRTPVMFATATGHKVVFDFLKSKGCNLMTLDDYGNNILHIACNEGRVDMVKYLMTLKPVERMKSKRNKRNRTPLTLAKVKGYESIVSVLKAGRV